MIQRFEKLVTGITRIYKSIQKIKKNQMNILGLKGTHVMCLHFLSRYPEGLTATRLSQLCNEDKAGISRILADLEQKRLIRYSGQESKKKYQSNADRNRKERGTENQEADSAGRKSRRKRSGGKGIGNFLPRFIYHCGKSRTGLPPDQE